MLKADGIIKPPNCFRAAPEITELFLFVQRGRGPDDMVMDMGFINVGADDKGVIPFGEPLGQFATQAVCFLRG